MDRGFQSEYLVGVGSRFLTRLTSKGVIHYGTNLISYRANF